MSDIATNGIQLLDGSKSIASEYVINGSAKAWANLDGTGTIALRDSVNISSVTDQASGQYRFDVTNLMLNSNYAVSGLNNNASSTTGGNMGIYNGVSTTGFTTLNRQSSNGNLQDLSYVACSVDGDLA